MQRVGHAQKWDMCRIVYEDNWPDNEVDMTFIESKASRQMKYKKKLSDQCLRPTSSKALQLYFPTSPPSHSTSQ